MMLTRLCNLRDLSLKSIKSTLLYSLLIQLFLLNFGNLDGYAKETAQGFQEKGESLNFKDLVPHLVSNENYVEKYTFDAELESADGLKGQLYFSASINNLGAGDHKLHLKGRLTVGEQKFTWNKKFASGKWKNNKSQLSISAGGISLSSIDGEKLRFKVDSKENSFDLVLTPQVKAWRPKNGGIHFRPGSKKAEFALFPMAKIIGSWSDKAGEPKTLSGTAWGRHTWSHLGPHEWIRWSQLIRIFDPNQQQSTFIRRIQLGGDFQDQILSYALVSANNQVIFEGYNLSTAEQKHYTDKKHDNKYRFPTQMTITAKSITGQGQLSLNLKTNKRLSRRNPIAHLSWAKRKLAEMFSKPMKYAYTFDYTLNVTGASSLSSTGHDGRYEIFHLN